MKTRAKYLASLASLMFLLLAGLPAQAASFDVAFYELTEQATFEFTLIDTNGDGIPDTPVPVKRTGEGSLAGEAKVGQSPLCPNSLVEALAAAGLADRRRPCYVTATGKDVIDLTTFTGTFDASIHVKVQADNPVDAPELVVLAATISGNLAIADPDLRLIAITDGFLTVTHVLDPSTFVLVAVPANQTPLTGMVRLPFVKGNDGKFRKPRRHEPAFYLDDDGKSIRVRNDEESLGLATARFELNLQGVFGKE